MSVPSCLSAHHPFLHTRFLKRPVLSPGLTLHSLPSTGQSAFQFCSCAEMSPVTLLLPKVLSLAGSFIDTNFCLIFHCLLRCSLAVSLRFIQLQAAIWKKAVPQSLGLSLLLIFSGLWSLPRWPWTVTICMEMTHKLASTH